MGLAVSSASAPLLKCLSTEARASGIYDLVILGGGCAGLSLAMRLASLGKHCPRTLVLERRSEYVNDRTWCFWGESSLPVRHLVKTRWNKVVLRHGQRVVEVECAESPYQMITGGDFYDEALRIIGLNKQIDLVTGIALLGEPMSVRDQWHLETSDGTFTGAAVVDTRPSRPPEVGQAVLWQSFFGCEIECDAEVFDPKSADLMHFVGGEKDRVDFNYVLPLSGHRALIEATVFGAKPVSQEALFGRFNEAIRERAKGKGFRILRSEHGILPMGAAPLAKASEATFVRAGLTAGGARASTGYAFQRIQRWADGCAQAISDGGLPTSHPPDPVLLQSLDYLFISVLREHPERAPDLFLSLFEKTEPERMTRFLSDCGTLRDYAMVAAALPAMPFIRAIPKAIRRKITQWQGRPL